MVLASSPSFAQRETELRENTTTGRLEWLQTHVTLHQMRCGFFLRGLDDERNSFCRLTVAETDEWRSAMWRPLGLGIASSRGGGVLWCSSSQGDEQCSTRRLGRSSLTWRWSLGGCGVAWHRRWWVGKACGNGGFVLSTNCTGRAPIYRGFDLLIAEVDSIQSQIKPDSNSWRLEIRLQRGESPPRRILSS
jgi:hypothetical protein